MRARRLVFGAGTVACLMGAGSAALGASAPTAGQIHVFISNVTSTTDTVLVTGAIGDYGRGLSVDANGKVDPNGNFQKVTLKHGGFVIDSTALNKTIPEQFRNEGINHANCSLDLVARGPSTVASGTGAYAGISGHLTVTLTVAGVAAKTKSGKCNPGGTAEFYGQYMSVTATGTVTFK